MNITVFGSDLVGVTVASCFSEMGNNVYLAVSNLNFDCNYLLSEPNLIPLFNKNRVDNLVVTENIGVALKNTNIIFITTKFNLNKTIRDIAYNLVNDSIIVIKDIVPLGTTFNIQNQIQTILKKRGLKLDIKFAFNPDFLKRGNVVHDFMKPMHIVIGAEDDKTFDILKELYSHFVQNHPRFCLMSIKDAEMVSQTYNAMISCENSFINEITYICELLGVNVEHVKRGNGLDSKINYNSILDDNSYEEYPSCEDLSFFIEDITQKGYHPLIISNSISFSQIQKDILLNKIISKFGEDLSDYKFCIWGVVSRRNDDSFNFQDSLISELIDKGAKINLFHYNNLSFPIELNSLYLVENKYDALKSCDALIVLNEYDEFKNPDFDLMAEYLNHKVIFDGINIYNKKIENEGFELYHITC